MSDKENKKPLNPAMKVWHKIQQAGKDLGVDTRTKVIPTKKQMTQKDFRPDR